MTVSIADNEQEAQNTFSRGSESQLKRALRRTIKTRSAQVGLVLVLSFLLIGIFAPIVSPYDARSDLNLKERLHPPSAEHPFGTDDLGRDVLTRVVHGARVSLQVGVMVVAISLTIGTMLGLVAGLFGGFLDSLIMRVMDVMLSFPYVLLAIALVAALGPGLRNAMIAIGIVYIPPYARLARSMALQIREEDFVLAARALGAGRRRIIFTHILPNGLSPLIVMATLSMGTAILDSAALGFLGLGQQPPYPEWGKMLVDSIQFILSGSWWVMLFPGLAIMLTVLGFNLLGDGLRDALDPRLRIG